jgi:hypothetical protein
MPEIIGSLLACIAALSWWRALRFSIAGTWRVIAAAPTADTRPAMV